MTSASPATSLRFVSMKELCARLSVSRPTIYALVERGELPEPVRITEGRIGWPSDLVDAWIAAKAATQ